MISSGSMFKEFELSKESLKNFVGGFAQDNCSAKVTCSNGTVLSCSANNGGCEASDPNPAQNDVGYVVCGYTDMGSGIIMATVYKTCGSFSD